MKKRPATEGVKVFKVFWGGNKYSIFFEFQGTIIFLNTSDSPKDYSQRSQRRLIELSFLSVPNEKHRIIVKLTPASQRHA